MSVMDFVNLEFADERMRSLQAVLPAVRSSQANVLITGPTGTGKSTLAKYILSSVGHAVLNIRDLAENFDFATFLATSSSRNVLIENIDLLNPAQQKALIEALDFSETSEKPRVVSTSRNSLKNLVQKNLFREDLYYRLTVLNFELPALTQRTSDIEVLAQHLINVFAIIHKKNGLRLSSQALDKMKTWSWPGNIREFENVVERAVILTEKDVIEPFHVAIENQQCVEETGFLAGMTLSQVEQKLILQTLQLTDQNRTRAAEILGISIRTLRNKINEYREAGLV